MRFVMVVVNGYNYRFLKNSQFAFNVSCLSNLLGMSCPPSIIPKWSTRLEFKHSVSISEIIQGLTKSDS